MCIQLRYKLYIFRKKDFIKLVQAETGYTKSNANMGLQLYS